LRLVRNAGIHRSFEEVGSAAPVLGFRVHSQESAGEHADFVIALDGQVVDFVLGCE
jgi:hypothetical protein